MQEVEVTEPVGRMVLAAFRLDLSTPVEFSKTVYSTKAEHIPDDQGLLESPLNELPYG
jgi:hypothetical protein